MWLLMSRWLLCVGAGGGVYLLSKGKGPASF